MPKKIEKILNAAGIPFRFSQTFDDCWMLSVILLQKQPPEVPYKEKCSWKFREIYRKTPIPESIF